MPSSTKLLEEVAPWITYRQLDFWCRKGYIRQAGPAGSGFSRQIPDTERPVLRLMARLVRIGLQAEQASKLARKAVKTGKDRVSIQLSPDDPGLILRIEL